MRGHRLHHGGLITPGVLLGVGLGGFVDGIVLHQLLQWHNMLSSVVPPDDVVAIKYNMVWDGVFHAFTWAMTVLGVALLWRAGQRPEVPWSTPTFVGSLLGGWGLFNFVEGLVDHHLLRIHHVRPGENELAWDLAFLASGLVLMGVGAAMVVRDISARVHGRGAMLPRPPGAR